jgi:hypothetical protein
MATTARANPKTGILEHKHDTFGFHWASAGHRDDGQIHKAADAAKPTFVEGTTPEQQANYLKALNREDGHVAKIPSKAKPKDEKSKDGEAAKSAASNGSGSAPARQPAASGAR